MHKTIIIISAFRSGSNLIKDVLCQIPGFGTWPSENINFIWRHGNSFRKDDEFSIAEANDYVKKYIRKAFYKLSKKNGYEYVVEKTEGNSLRVNFVNSIFPEAKLIFVVRDGRDAIASMLNRRKKPIDITFLLKKTRYLPLTDFPIVAIRYTVNNIRRFFFNKGAVYKLGPIFKNMEDITKSLTEAEIVAMQWAKCINKASEDLKNIETDRVHIIKYEDFVTKPRDGISSLVNFLDISMAYEDIELFINKILLADMGKETASPEMKDIKGISDKSVGRWKMQLDEIELDLIIPIIEHPMRELGYLEINSS